MSGRFIKKNVDLYISRHDIDLFDADTQKKSYTFKWYVCLILVPILKLYNQVACR